MFQDVKLKIFPAVFSICLQKLPKCVNRGYWDVEFLSVDMMKGNKVIQDRDFKVHQSPAGMYHIDI